MSLLEVREAFDNSFTPDETTISTIENLITIIPKVITEQKRFLHLLNIISHDNEESWLNQFQKIVSENWKLENEKIFASVIIQQPLYSDIYVKMINYLDKKTRDNIINSILNSKLTHVENHNVGIFIGKYLSTNDDVKNIEDMFKDNLEERAGIAIAMFIIFFQNDKKHLISPEILKQIKELTLNTKTLMKLYDFEDMYEN